MIDEGHCLQKSCDFLDELEDQNFALMETITLKMLENTWRETDFHLEILHAR